MLLNTLRSDLMRCFHLKKIVFILVSFVMVLLIGQTEYIQSGYKSGYGATGIINILGNALAFDKFKIVLVLLLATLYTDSFCKDNNTHYLRMILNRTKTVSYTQARFIINTLFIIFISILGFILSAVILMPFFSMIPLFDEYDCYYNILAMKYPFLYIILMGFQFGILVAAFSSIGLAFSVFQSNSFVSIGITGLAFFLSASYIPESSVFDVLPIVSLAPSFIKSFQASKAVNLSWSILYPFMVIVICGYIFYRRLDWRVNSGNS